MRQTIFFLFLCISVVVFGNDVCIESLKKSKLDSTDVFENLLRKSNKVENIHNSIQLLLEAKNKLTPKNERFSGILNITLANKYKDIGQYDKALEIIGIAERFAHETCPALLKKCYGAKSSIYWYSNHFDEAIKWRLKFKEVSLTKQDSLTADYNLLGIYHDLKDTNMVNYYLDGFNSELAEETNRVHPIIKLMVKTIEINYVFDFDSKLNIIKEIKPLANKYGSKFKYQILIAEGELYKGIDNRKSISLFESILPEIERSGLSSFKTLAELNLIEIYIKENQINQANMILSRVDTFELPDRQKGDFLRYSIIVNKSLGNSDKALFYAQNLINHNNRISELSRKKAYAKWSKQYQTEKKIQEAALLTNTTIIQKQSLEKQALVNRNLWVIISFVFIGLILLYFQFKKSKKHSLQIEERNEKEGVR